MANCVVENMISPILIAQFVEVLDAKPELPDHLTEIWQAFHFLSSARPTGMGIEAIPPPWLYDYCDRHGLVGEEQERAVYLLSEMDKQFRSLLADKQKQTTET